MARALRQKGFTAPTWPTEFGGGGLSAELAKVLYEEMGKVNARTPLTGMGMTMIGPTLLEYGTQDQKERHLPKIIRGELQWCQGYSEPNAGSDLAALNTRAEDKGDHYLLNGQKIWTSGAFTADWMFALVRTDFDAPKHEGISFVLLPMDQEGVTVKPIRLISGHPHSARHSSTMPSLPRKTWLAISIRVGLLANVCCSLNARALAA